MSKFRMMTNSIAASLMKPELQVIIEKAHKFKTFPHHTAKILREIALTQHTLVMVNDEAQQQGLIWELQREALEFKSTFCILDLGDADCIDLYLTDPHLDKKGSLKTEPGLLAKCIQHEKGILVLVGATHPNAEGLNGILDHSTFRGYKIHPKLRIIGIALLDNNVMIQDPFSPAFRRRYGQIRSLPAKAKFSPPPQLSEWSEWKVERLTSSTAHSERRAGRVEVIDLQAGDALSVETMLTGSFPRNQNGRRIWKPSQLLQALASKDRPLNIIFKNVHPYEQKVHALLNNILKTQTLNLPLYYNRTEYSLTDVHFFQGEALTTQKIEALIANKTITVIKPDQCHQIKNKWWISNELDVRQLFALDRSELIQNENRSLYFV